MTKAFPQWEALVHFVELQGDGSCIVGTQQCSSPSPNPDPDPDPNPNPNLTLTLTLTLTPTPTPSLTLSLSLTLTPTQASMELTPEMAFCSALLATSR